MALKLNERYPGRFDNPSAGYPQGSFKNRTAPSAKDGSYLEKDWANDKEGFFQSLLASAVVQANGSVDKVGSSQYFNALLSIIGNVGVSWANISGKPTTLAGYRITDGMLAGTGGIGATSSPQAINVNTLPYGGLWSVNPGTVGAPFANGSVLHNAYDVASGNWTQIFADMGGSSMYWRGSLNYSISNLKKFWDSENFNPVLKVTGDSCPTAGFYGGSKTRPYMQHADATVVELPTLAQLVATNAAVAQRITAINCSQAGFVDGTTNTPFMTHSNGTTVGLASTAYTGLGFQIVKGETGYIKFPNFLGGFILQWTKTPTLSTGVNYAWNFPLGFPSFCAGVSGTMIGTSQGPLEVSVPPSTASVGLAIGIVTASVGPSYVWAWGW